MLPSRRAVRWTSVATVALVFTGGCAGPDEPGAAVRLLAGAADTVVVNHRTPVPIPMRAFDKEDRDAAVSGVRYSLIAGDSLDVTPDGMVTCTRRGDATVRAVVGTLASELALHCRPVKALRLPGPIQFALGDSSQLIPLEAIGLDGEPVGMIAGKVSSQRGHIVAVRSGLRIAALATGVSLLSVSVGDARGRVGVHVYEPVETLNGIRADQRLFSLPLKLQRGEVRRWQLPPGQWMFTMMPYEDERTGLQLRVEGARCVKTNITPRRIVCESKQSTTIIVYHPLTTAAPVRTGWLLVRRVNS